MKISAMKVVKCMPLSYVNLKTKLKCFLELLSLNYKSSFYYLKNNTIRSGHWYNRIHSEQTKTESNRSLHHWHP